MPIYLIEETTAVNARREGYKKQFKCLSEAKRYASRNQSFYGTILNIYTECGTYLLAYKSPSYGGVKAKWHND